MALKAFRNLKQERQDKILSIAFEEFALKGYDNASLSSIIKNCGLAKGSFYRYFSNKKELYTYLISVATQKRLSKLDAILADPNISFYQMLKVYFLEKVQFDMDYPVMGGFLQKILQEKDNQEIAEIVAQLRDAIIDRITHILQISHYKLNIKSKNLHMVAYHIFQMQLWLYDYIALKFKLNLRQIIKQGNPVLDVPVKDLEKLVKKSIALIKSGIEN